MNRRAILTLLIVLVELLALAADAALAQGWMVVLLEYKRRHT